MNARAVALPATRYYWRTESGVALQRRGYSLLLTRDECVAGRLMEQAQRFTIVLRAPSYAHARSMLPRRPDWAGLLIDLDEHEADPLSVARGLREIDSLVPMLALSSRCSPELINGLHAARVELTVKPVQVANVESFLRRALVSGFIPDARLAAWVDVKARECGLSSREVQLMAYVLGGESRTQIMRRLGIGENTLKTQVRSLLRKCRARNMDRLAFRALREALIAESFPVPLDGEREEIAPNLARHEPPCDGELKELEPRAAV